MMTHDDAMLIVTAIHEIYKILNIIGIGIFSIMAAKILTWVYRS